MSTAECRIDSEFSAARECVRACMERQEELHSQFDKMREDLRLLSQDDDIAPETLVCWCEEAIVLIQSIRSPGWQKSAYITFYVSYLLSLTSLAIRQLTNISKRLIQSQERDVDVDVNNEHHGD